MSVESEQREPIVPDETPRSGNRGRLLRGVGFLVVLGVGFALGRILSGSSAARVSDQVHEFGRVTSTGRLRHTFEFRNWTLRPLQISRVRTTCGCTVATYTETPIPPLGKGVVDAELNLEGKHDRVETEIHLDFGDRGKATFALRAEVTPLSPARIDLGRVMRDTATSRTFLLASANGVDPLKVNGHQFSRPGLTAEFAPVDGAPEHVSVRVRATDELPSGPLQTVLTVHTNDPLMPEKEVTFHGFVVPPVEAVPSQVSLGYFGADKPAAAELTLRSAYGKAIELASAEVPDSWLDWRRKASTTHDKVHLVLSTKAEALEPGLHSADLVFHVQADGESVEVKVRVFGYVFANSNPFGAPSDAAPAQP